MLDFGAVSLEWGTMITQMLIFTLLAGMLLVPILLVVEMSRRKSSRNQWKKSMETLEKRIEALEKERNLPKQ
ncbi:hypothetical protein [Brevibacillus choshinensis]|uniref:hypothetical protein n=1 Tax=Brevibacillus choshinensis TaxID=54911 RepID=UPI001EEF2B2D|nr:hypothetical protein [Brevibacillus choshinensis]